MKQFKLWYFAIFVLVFSTAALAGTSKDRMNYEGPVTFKGAVNTGYPNAAGTMSPNCVVSHNHSKVAGGYTLTAAEAQCSYLVFTNFSSTTSTVTKPAAVAGKQHILYNNSGKTISFKVSGQTGATIATGKKGLYIDNGTDVVEFYEQP